jgi:hypothetical protein
MNGRVSKDRVFMGLDLDTVGAETCRIFGSESDLSNIKTVLNNVSEKQCSG